MPSADVETVWLIKLTVRNRFPVEPISQLAAAPHGSSHHFKNAEGEVAEAVIVTGVSGYKYREQ